MIDDEPEVFISWHDWRPLIEAAQTKEAENTLIKAALLGPHVFRTNGMLIEGNDYGKPYSCMDQGDMGVVLIRFRKTYGPQADGKLSDGIKCMRVITEPVISGGLRTRSSGCSWFHGKTSRSSRALGYTLNKHLHACRSLADAANALVEIGGNASLVDEYRKACREGIRQLVEGSLNVADFSCGHRSWLFYSQNGNGTDGHFNDNGKNGTYHLYCMRLLTAINDRCPGVNWTGFAKRSFLRPYENKLAEGLYVNSTPSVGGNFEALRASEEPLSDTVLTFFRS